MPGPHKASDASSNLAAPTRFLKGMMMLIFHKDLLDNKGYTRFHKMERGEYFYPILQSGDLQRWRRRACRAGRNGKKYFKVILDKGIYGFYIKRVA